jgi:hypothetical protein
VKNPDAPAEIPRERGVSPRGSIRIGSRLMTGDSFGKEADQETTQDQKEGTPGSFSSKA